VSFLQSAGEDYRQKSARFGVIDAFVGRLDMAVLGFERAEAAETGRHGYRGIC